MTKVMKVKWTPEVLEGFHNGAIIALNPDKGSTIFRAYVKVKTDRQIT